MILFGNLGKNQNVNGQVVKTNEIIILLRNIGISFDIFDTSNKNPLNFILTILLRKKDTHLICLGKKGIILYFLITKLFFLRPQSVYFFIVGGWFPNLIDKWYVRILASSILKKSYLFVESESMIPPLTRIGFNAILLANFRTSLGSGKLSKKKSLSTFRLIFLSRIIPEKGIYEAIELVNQLNSAGKKTYLDIYGVASREEIKKLCDKVINNEYIKFNGELHPSISSKVISKYHFLILPTRYYGECMPGVVVESLASGTPVLTTDWLYMPEMIKNNHTGGVFHLDSFCEEAKNWLLELDENSYFLMQKKCLEDFRLRFSFQKSRNIISGYLSSYIDKY